MARKDTITNALRRSLEEQRDGNGREAQAALRDAMSASESEWAGEMGDLHGYSDGIE